MNSKRNSESIENTPQTTSLLPKGHDSYYYEEWPEKDVLGLRVQQHGKEIKLITYRHPVDTQQCEKKAVVFYIHGYGGYCERISYMFKHLAAAGYECFGLDQRGFGKSEGERAWLESQELIYSDLWLFIFTTIQKFNINLQKTPLFLLGKSFGGLLSFNLSSELPSMFRGMALCVPFFGEYGNSIEKNAWVFKTLDYIYPRKEFSSSSLKPDMEKSDYYQKYKHYFTDSNLVTQAKSRTLLIFLKEHEKAKQILNQNQAKIPTLFIIAGKDNVISNTAIDEVYKRMYNCKNKLVRYEEADHTTITVDNDYAREMAQDIIKYFDSLL
eukprot:403358334